MALDMMEAVFDMDEAVTQAAASGQEGHTEDVPRQMGHGPLEEIMLKVIKNAMESMQRGKFKMPFCVEVCAVQEMMDNFGNMTTTINSLHHILSALEICVMVMTCSVTVFAVAIVLLAVYYTRKTAGQGSIIPCSSKSITATATPSNTGSSGSSLIVREMSMKPIDSTPPPSRQADYRVRTPMTIAWSTVDKDCVPDKPVDPRVPTPMPFEFNEDDDQHMRAPPGPQYIDAGRLAAHNAMARKPSWPVLGIMGQPLEEDGKEGDENIS